MNRGLAGILRPGPGSLSGRGLASPNPRCMLVSQSSGLLRGRFVRLHGVTGSIWDRRGQLRQEIGPEIVGPAEVAPRVDHDMDDIPPVVDDLPDAIREAIPELSPRRDHPDGGASKRL